MIERQEDQTAPRSRWNTALLLVIIGIIVVLVSAIAARDSLAREREWFEDVARERLGTPVYAEALYVLPRIGALAVASHKKRGSFCSSSSHPVPDEVARVANKKFATSDDDWRFDERTQSGFACLQWAFQGPQLYQYDYRSDGHSFVVIARGDRDGDGVYSTFRLRGGERDGAPFVDVAVERENPKE